MPARKSQTGAALRSVKSQSLGLPPDAHILLCDDDAELRRLLGSVLRSNGYRVTTIGSGREVADKLRQAAFDLVILDIMLPGASGLEVCRDLRAASAVPILMLTAKGTEVDRIVGLEMGADDYVGKPFSPPELLARIKALLRRSRMQHGAAPVVAARTLVFQGWRLDLLRRELRDPEGVIIDLSAGEYDLLLAFLEAPQRVLSREFLLETTRDANAAGFDRSIDVQVSRLRRKMDLGDATERLIKTVRGAGYMFMADVQRS